jgi:hypothetical protein
MSAGARPKTRSRGRLATMLVVACLLAACSNDTTNTAAPRAAHSTLPVPTVTGPIEGGLRGRPWAGALPSRAPLADFDYVEEEYFYSGTASSRDLHGQATGGEAPYTTRMLVARPRDPARFNGTVIVEWLNVTAAMDLPVVWTLAHREILRGGYAYVGISAQTIAVGASPLALKFWDPLRYAPLQHPGDAYMHDIFAQSAAALMSTAAPRPLGELAPRRIIAAGESQSCSLLALYANVIDAEHRAFDGYFLHSCATAIDPGVAVPVLLFLNESELDGFTAPSSATPLPPVVADVPGLGLLRILMLDNGVPPDSDGPRHRVWEIAGGSHFDQQALAYLAPLLAYNLAAPLLPPLNLPDLPLGCARLPNRLAMERPTRAALRQLHAWTQEGRTPPTYPRVARHADGSIARDDDGLALGGIRMPPMLVPDGVNIGDDCPFIGSYTPFDRAQMQARYGDAANFMAAVAQAADQAVATGALLAEDAPEYVGEASAIAAQRFPARR